jgi:hypothetical protein
MTSKLVAKAVAGALALTAGSAALASGTTAGDLFLNINDYSISNNVETSSSYFFDTGIALASFNPSSSYSFNLSTDSNFTGNAVLTAPAGGGVNYSVLAGTTSGSGITQSYSVDFTSNLTPPVADQLKLNTKTAYGAINAFFTQTGFPTTASSAYLAGTGWGGNTNYEGTVSTNLVNQSAAPYGDNAAPGTPLSFYNQANATLTTFAGSWDLVTSNGVTSLIWSPGSTSVPLPAPLVLLLSGLGLLGLIARRGRGSDLMAGALT